MKNMGKLYVISSVLAAAVLLFSSVPVAALDRSGGDFWEYDVEMSLDLTDVGLAPFELTGTMTHTFAEEDEVTVDGTEYDINVLEIEGSVSGAVDLVIMEINLTITLSGSTSETSGGIATVTDDIMMHMNASMDMGGGFVISMIMIMETTGTYSPPYLSGFEPGDTGTGDEWDEEVSESITTKMWYNSTSTTPLEDTVEYTMNYSMTVADDRDEIETDAGTFNCLKVTVEDESGNREIYWVSEDVGYIVKKETWADGANAPSETLMLTDYEWTNPATMLMYIVIGVVVVVVAVGVLAYVMMKKKKAKPAVAPPPAEQPGAGQ